MIWWIVAGALLLLWLLGFVVMHLLGGFVHVLIIAALIVAGYKGYKYLQAKQSAP